MKQLGPRCVPALGVVAGLAIVVGMQAQAQVQPRILGSLEVAVHGLQARPEPLRPVVPKLTAAGLRVVVRAGTRLLSAQDVAVFLGGPFEIQGELSGPGLATTLALPSVSAAPSPDPLVLGLPALPQAGDYTLANLRLVRAGRSVLDVMPSRLTVQVVDQVLVTAVHTRPLSVVELRSRGVVLDARSYLGFEFTVGLRLESTLTQIKFPALFDRRGVALPLPLQPPPDFGTHVHAPPLALIPVLMRPDEEAPNVGTTLPQLQLPDGAPLRIPSLLVIPGNIGYLKQFFSAQLLVANAAPGGSGLVVRNVRATLRPPKGADGVFPSADDPLSLPDLEDGPQALTRPIERADGGAATLLPSEQGQAEFVLRGEQEGFHALDFDIRADLDGLPVGTLPMRSEAHGGVLVRNPYFDLTFSVPTTVRGDQVFSTFVNVTNTGRVPGQLVTVALDVTRVSGAEPAGPTALTIDALPPGESRLLEFKLRSLRTGEVQASYLRFDTAGGSQISGRLDFTLGVDERGQGLSPDTLQLPASVSALPEEVVHAALRVLGQAWSISGSRTLAPGVLPIPRALVVQKALALAEAGLRVSLRGNSSTALHEALGELLLDFHGGTQSDAGFDQLLRTTSAGSEFDARLGNALAAAAQAAGGPLAYEERLAAQASSGASFLSWTVVPHGVSSPVAEIALVDDLGRRTRADGPRDVPQALLIRLGADLDAPQLGWLEAPPADASYALQVNGLAAGDVDLSLTVPRPDGTPRRATLTALPVGAGTRARVLFDPQSPDLLALEQDQQGDGVYESRSALASTPIAAEGPRLLAATTLGPETLAQTVPSGVYAALLFDRRVSAEAAGEVARYTLPSNAVQAARRQLSGRMVFLALAQPEGPHVPVSLSVEGLPDERGRTRGRQDIVLGSRLTRPGAIVSGRVLAADGTPVAHAVVTYANAFGRCDEASDNIPVAQQEVDQHGRYELRYVFQDPCGRPFRLSTFDPQTHALRHVIARVRSDGERQALDLVLVGSGRVAGTVRRADGTPAAFADVRVGSVEDTQVAVLTRSDDQGRYLAERVTVGGVAVSAALGTHLGRAAGRIPSAGATATVDVTLDGDVRVHGVVSVLAGAVTRPVADVLVTYSQGATVLGFTVTDTQGRYELDGLPPGAYRLEAALNTRDHASVVGTAQAGDVLERDLVIVPPAPTTLGTIRGHVRLPNGTPVAGARVSLGTLAVLADAQGAYELTGIVPDASLRRLQALSPDLRRDGFAEVVLNAPGQVLDAIDIVFRGLGRAQFQVFDEAGQAVGAGHSVTLLGLCSYVCGCRFTTTDASGQAAFDDVLLGSVGAQAIVRRADGTLDAVRGALMLSQDGQVATGVLRLAGFGSVRVRVVRPDGTPVPGAAVDLDSLRYVNDGSTRCGLELQPTHHGTTGADGLVTFTRVHVGSLWARAQGVDDPAPAGVAGVLPQAGQTVELRVTLAHSLVPELSGSVRLSDGTLVTAGVEVSVQGPIPELTTRTTADGRYRFLNVLPTGTYTLTARDNRSGGSGERLQARVALRGGELSTHDLRLKGRGPLRVQVVDANDVPVDTQALVRVSETEFPFGTYEAWAGGATGAAAPFAAVFSGPITIEVHDQVGRGARVSLTLPPNGQPVDARVRLTTTGTVSGRFQLPGTSEPVGLASVRLLSGGRLVGQVTTPAAGPDMGRFHFDWVPAGPLRVEAFDPRSGRSGVAAGSLANEGEAVTLDVTAQAVGRVQGLVTLNGSAVPSAQVLLRAGGYHLRLNTDAAGLYVAEGVPEGAVYVLADLGQGFLQGFASAVSSGEGSVLDLPVALHPAGAVEGRVLRATSDDPAPPTLVRIDGGGVATYESVVTSADGRYRFSRVPAGMAWVSAELLGSPDRGRESVSVPAAETRTLDVRLAGLGTLVGHVRDGATPLAGRVYLRGTGRLPWWLTTVSNAAGVFTVPGVLAGPFTAQFYRTDGPVTLGALASGTLTPGQTLDFDVVVEPTGRVTGRVLKPNGQPAIGVEVSVQHWVVAGRTLSVQTGFDGRFSASGFPIGQFRLTAHDAYSNGVARIASATLLADQTLDVGDLTLDDTPPTVVSMTPAEGAQDVPIDTPVVVTFSDPVGAPEWITVQPFLTRNPQLSSDGRTVTIQGTLPDSSDITAVAWSSMTDVYGRPLGVTTTRRFRTVDLTPPRVTQVSPAANAIEVSSTPQVVVDFSEPLDPGAAIDDVVRLHAGPLLAPGVRLAASVARTGAAQLTLTPTVPLADNARFTLYVSGQRDVAGNIATTVLSQDFATHDAQAPQLTGAAPTGFTGLVRPTVVLYLQETGSGVDPTRTITRLDGQVVSAQVNPFNIGYTATSDLAQGAHTFTARVYDRAGNFADLTHTFGVDSLPPDAPALSFTPDQVLSGVTTLRASAADAGSGIQRVEYATDGNWWTGSITAPDYPASWDTRSYADGLHTLAARAIDNAAQASPASAALRVLVNNHVLGVTLTAPTSGAPVRDTVDIAASADEPVQRIEFQAGAAAVVSDGQVPYGATLDLSTFPEGSVTLSARAFGLVPGETALAVRSVVVDRTAPAAPDAAKLGAESDGVQVLVAGAAGAVEGGVQVEATNTATSAIALSLSAAADGSFAVRLPGVLGQTLSLVAVDAAGNRSTATLLTITRTLGEDALPLDGLALWLRSDSGVVVDGTGRVSRWEDRSGHANHLVQSSTTLQPLRVPNVLAGHPVVRFDGVNDALDFTAGIAAARSVLVVLREDAAATAQIRALLGYSSGQYGLTGNTTSLWSSWSYPAVLSGETWLNGSPVDGLQTGRPKQFSALAALPSAPVGVSRLSAAYGAVSWHGDIVELLVYDRTLSPEDRKAAEDYLARRYGLYVPRVATPSINPAGGRFTGATTVTLGTRTPGADLRYSLDGTEPSSSGLSYADPLVLAETTTVKAKAFRPGYPDSGTAVAGFVRSSEFGPADLAGLRLWLRADMGVVADTNGRVRTWRDQSGLGNDLVQTAVMQQPLLLADGGNGRPALAFDGSDDALLFTSPITSARTLFLVLKEDAAAVTKFRAVLGYGMSTNTLLGNNTTLFSTGYVPAVVSAGELRLNSVPVPMLTTARPRDLSIVTLAATGAFSIDRLFTISHALAGNWHGQIAELVAFDRALSAAERRAVEDYLGQRHQPPGYALATATPSVSPNGGRFTNSVTVTLRSVTPGADVRYTLDGSEPSETSNLYTGTLTLTTTTTLRARAFASGLPPSRAIGVRFERSDEWSPLALTGLKLWARADAGLPVADESVLRWADQSGNGNDLVQTDGAAAPTIVPGVINGLPAVAFDGSNDKLALTTGINVRTLVAVLKEDNAATAVLRALAGPAGTGGGFVGSTTMLWSTGYGAAGVLNGQTWLNGTAVDGTLVGRPRDMSVLASVTSSNVYVSQVSASPGATSWHGPLAELLLFDVALDANQLQQLQQYLVEKYRPTLWPLQVATPAMTPSPARFTTTTNVTLTTLTPQAELRYTLDGSEPTTESTLYTAPFELSATTLVRAKAWRPGWLASATTSVTFLRDADAVPTSPSGLSLWLRSDSGVEVGTNSHVVRWRDQAGTGNDALPELAKARVPLVSATSVVGRQPLHFDGLDDGLLLNTRLASVGTLFAVLREDPGTSAIWRDLTGDSQYTFTGGTTTLWGVQTPAIVKNGTTRFNGVAVNGSTLARPQALTVMSLVPTSAAGLTYLLRSNGAGGPWRGDLLEVVAYNRALSLAEIKQVEQYLGARYGVTVQP